MTRPRVKLDVTDGRWIVGFDGNGPEGELTGVPSAQPVQWTGPVPVLNLEERGAWLEQLKAEPLDIYRLLKGEACLSLDEIVQLAAETAVSSRENGVGAVEDVKEALQAGLKNEPQHCPALIGMTPEELLEYVFSAWAGELSHVQRTSPRLSLPHARRADAADRQQLANGLQNPQLKEHCIVPEQAFMPLKSICHRNLLSRRKLILRLCCRGYPVLKKH